MGSPLYMSPEQGQGEPLDHRSDIYSLGATFYHLLAGRPPFDAKTPIGVIAQHMTKSLPPVRHAKDDIPEAFTRVLERMLAKDPKDRYQDYDALIDDLKAARPRAANRAGFVVRAMAFAVDLVVFIVLGLVLGKLGIAAFALYVILGWWRRGKTIGKWLFKLQVRDKRNEVPSLARATARFVGMYWGFIAITVISAIRLLFVHEWGVSVEGDYDNFAAFWADNAEKMITVGLYLPIFLLQGLGLLWAGIRKHNLSWHDIVTGTMVVYDLDDKR